MAILDRCESRQDATVRLLAVHSSEGYGTAQALRDASWWTGSSHAINDETGTLLTPAQGCVPYSMASWTLRSGNRVSENIEQVGWARYTRTEWLARPKLLDGTARWLADRSKARGIPLVKLSPADVRAGKAGVIGHVDWTLGMSDGTHTDPGPGYPWDVVIDKARQIAGGVTPIEEDDLDATQAAQLKAVEQMCQATLRQLGVAYQLGGAAHGTVTVPGWPQLGGRTLVDAIAFLLKQDDKPVDVEQIATAVAASVAEKLDGQTAATKEDVAEVVRSVFVAAGTA